MSSDGLCRKSSLRSGFGAVNILQVKSMEKIPIGIPFFLDVFLEGYSQAWHQKLHFPQSLPHHNLYKTVLFP